MIEMLKHYYFVGRQAPMLALMSSYTCEIKFVCPAGVRSWTLLEPPLLAKLVLAKACLPGQPSLCESQKD